MHKTRKWMLLAVAIIMSLGTLTAFATNQTLAYEQVDLTLSCCVVKEDACAMTMNFDVIGNEVIEPHGVRGCVIPCPLGTGFGCNCSAIPPGARCNGSRCPGNN